MNRKDALKIVETHALATLARLYDLEGAEVRPVPGHEQGRNIVLTCRRPGMDTRMLRISYLGDRSREALMAEAEYVRRLHANGGSVAGIIESCEGNLVEEITFNGKTLHACMFEKAKGMLLVENNYRYREGAPLEEYYFNCGKTLGRLHHLSQGYAPKHPRQHFLEKYTPEHIDRLVPASLPRLKDRMKAILRTLGTLERNRDTYGMIHFDYCDGNYAIDFETGDITVFDFDNACFGWFLYDLADVWRSGVGWVQLEADALKRRQFMDAYFQTALTGYRSETCCMDEMLSMLPLFLQVTQMEAVLDYFEYARLMGETLECDEELAYQIQCLEEDIPYLGFFDGIYACEAPFEGTPRDI